MESLLSVDSIVSLLTLTFLEIVLGIDNIIFISIITDNLPKTRSGKIMRRLLRTIARGEEITGDTSTLENEAILDQLRGLS